MSSSPDYSHGFIREGKVFLKAYRDQPERAIGEVRDGEAETLAYFEQRFEHHRQKVEALLSDIDRAQNKGSYLMKLVHLRDQLATLDALGDFAALYDRLANKEQEIRDLIEQNRVKNLEIKRALLLEAQALHDSVDWKGTAERMKVLKSHWVKTGAVRREYQEELEEGFRLATDGFFARRKAYFADRNELIDARVAQYEGLIERAEQLRGGGGGRPSQVLASLKQLHEAWKEVGGVPKAKSNELWARFKRINDEVYQSTRHGKDGKPAARARYLETNLRIKEQLCTEAVALAEVPLPEAIERAKTLQAHWKNTGPVPPERRQELNEVFVTACDRVFELSYVMRVTHARHRNFPQQPPAKQLSLKLQVLHDLIHKDEAELATFEGNIANVSVQDRNQPISRMLQSKLRGYRRKLRIKQEMLQTFRAERPERK
ncbi:MAG: DUF349 domain-containing protein [Catalinimonas sp.]